MVVGAVGGKGILERATDGSKHSEMMVDEQHRSIPSTTRLDRQTQLTTSHP